MCLAAHLDRGAEVVLARKNMDSDLRRINISRPAPQVILRDVVPEVPQEDGRPPSSVSLDRFFSVRLSLIHI